MRKNSNLCESNYPLLGKVTLSLPEPLSDGIFHATFFSLYPATEIISSSLAASTFSFSKGFRYVSVTLIEKWPNALLMMPILIPA